MFEELIRIIAQLKCRHFNPKTIYTCCISIYMCVCVKFFMVGGGVGSLLPTNVIKFQEYTIELDGCILASDYTVLFLSSVGLRCCMLPRELDADILTDRSDGKRRKFNYKTLLSLSSSSRPRTNHSARHVRSEVVRTLHIYIYIYIRTCVLSI